MPYSVHLKYLAVNDLDLKWGTAVSSIGHQDIRPGASYPPSYASFQKEERLTGHYVFSTEKGRILNEYQLLYIIKGKGYFYSKSLGKETCNKIESGDMFLLFPGEWHNYFPRREVGWEEYWIGFSGASIDLDNGLFNPSKPIFHVGLQNEIVRLYLSAIEIATRQESGFQLLLSGIVNYILRLVWFYDRNNAFKATAIDLKMAQAKLLVESQIATITPETLASQLKMCYSTFRRIFRTYTGFAPAKYIAQKKHSKAKELLSGSSMTVKEIAYSLGFRTYEYFFSFFSANENGDTPLAYRQRSH